MMLEIQKGPKYLVSLSWSGEKISLPNNHVQTLEPKNLIHDGWR